MYPIGLFLDPLLASDSLMTSPIKGKCWVHPIFRYQTQRNVQGRQNEGIIDSNPLSWRTKKSAGTFSTNKQESILAARTTAQSQRTETQSNIDKIRPIDRYVESRLFSGNESSARGVMNDHINLSDRAITMNYNTQPSANNTGIKFTNPSQAKHSSKVSSQYVQPK